MVAPLIFKYLDNSHKTLSYSNISHSHQVNPRTNLIIRIPAQPWTPPSLTYLLHLPYAQKTSSSVLLSRLSPSLILPGYASLPTPDDAWTRLQDYAFSQGFAIVTGQCGQADPRKTYKCRPTSVFITPPRPRIGGSYRSIRGKKIQSTVPYGYKKGLRSRLRAANNVCP